MKRIKDMKYGGVYGSAEYSGLEECFFGSIKGISDLIIYEGRTKKDLYQNFIAAVNNWHKEKVK